MEEKELPKNWIETSIGTIAKVVTGNTPSKRFPEYYGGEIPWVKPADINTGVVIYKTKETLTDIGGGNARILPIGSVMVTCIGNLGNVAIAGTELATNQQINSIVIKHDFIDKKYTYYWSLMMKPWLVENSTSTTISMVNKSNFEKAPFLLPPLPEQKRIVAKLDQLFGHLEELKQRLEGIPKLIMAFRQSVLTQAVTGKLTEGWKTIKNIKHWNEVKLDDVIQEKPRNGFSPRGVAYETPVKSLSLSATTSGKFDGSKVKYLDIDIPDKDSHLWLMKGDILIQRSNSLDYVGTAAIYDGEDGEFIYPDIMMKVKVNEKIINTFLDYCLKEQRVRDYYKNNATGTAGNMPKINQGIVMNTPISLPSIEEQKEIIRRVESLFTKIDTIKSHYQELESKIEDLPQAILAKTFRGELVEQLETDGDARDLLEQIKNEKERIKEKQKLEKKKSMLRKERKPKEVFRLDAFLELKHSESAFTFLELWSEISNKLKYEDFKKQFFSLIQKDFKLDWENIFKGKENVLMSFNRNKKIITFKVENLLE